jgi:hypothetical protein
MTSLFSYLTPKEMPLICHHENPSTQVYEQSDIQVAFRNVSKGERYYQAKKKTISGKI